jgi:thiol-disulfide isomerase/thioredoxin
VKKRLRAAAAAFSLLTTVAFATSPSTGLSGEVDARGLTEAVAREKGKVVLVNFWATWCVPCRVEMPEFVKTYPAYRERGVEFVGAANEPRSNKAKVREFMQGMQIDFPIWLEASEEHLQALGVGPGLPSTVIVDGQGRIAARITGTTDGAQLRDLLDRLLSEKASSGAAGEH